MATEPSPAIVAPFVDDDRHPANAGGAKAIERVLDQGPPADRRHGLARTMTVGSQAGPVSSGDDPAPEHFRRGGHLRTFRRSGSFVTAAGTDRGPVASAAAAWTSSGAIQMKPM